jgi:7-cyano-7-deazaguanine synthase in queuosine biosynthesis
MATMDTLLHFSGGIDSTFILWKYLKENPDKVLLVHHINLCNREGRQDFERMAVRNILNWLKENGYDNFEYVETTYIQPKKFYIQYDLFFYLGYSTPVLFNTYRTLRYVLRSTISSDLDQAHNLRERRAEIVCFTILGYMPRWVKENHKNSKKDEIKKMPKELFDLTWWCRKPNKNKPCHKCHTCKIVDKALKQLKRPNPHD